MKFNWKGIKKLVHCTGIHTALVTQELQGEAGRPCLTWSSECSALSEKTSKALSKLEESSAAEECPVQQECLEWRQFVFDLPFFIIKQ